jgi:hypothetical protein
MREKVHVLQNDVSRPSDGWHYLSNTGSHYRTRFESRPGDRLPWFHPGHDRLFPNSYQFVYHPTIKRYTVSTLNASLRNAVHTSTPNQLYTCIHFVFKWNMYISLWVRGTITSTSISLVTAGQQFLFSIGKYTYRCSLLGCGYFTDGAK